MIDTFLFSEPDAEARSEASAAITDHALATITGWSCRPRVQ
jgi:hypothetical protein